MKKKLIIAATVLICGSLCFSGCGKKEKTADGIDIVNEEYPATQCVNLAEWKGISLEKRSATPTDDEVTAYAASSKEAIEVTDPDAVAEQGDLVNIDYNGKINGESFENGSGAGMEIRLGDSSFPEEFETAIINMKVGEMNTVTVTLSDAYGVDLKGKKAEYTIKLNGIKRSPELSAEEITAAKKELEDTEKKRDDTLLKESAWETVVKDSQIKMIPKNVIENAAEEYKSQIRYLYGSISDYRKQTGKSKKAWEEELKKNSEEQAEKQLLVKTCAYKMKIAKESEAYKDKEKEFCEKNGLSKKDMISLYGKKEFQCMVLQELVVAKIIDEATIDEN